MLKGINFESTFMRKLLALILTLTLSVCLGKTTYAQSDESRTKIQLAIMFKGKSIITDLNSVATSLSRYYDTSPMSAAAKDTTKKQLQTASATQGQYYINMDAKSISDELLKVLAGKQNRFDGTITITDAYGKKPTRTIAFKQAALYSYSDQYSTMSYTDSYASTAISFDCKELSINGIALER